MDVLIERGGGSNPLKMLLLGAEDLARALTMRDALGAVRRAFTALSTAEASVPPRGVVEVADRGATLLMGAHLPGTGLASKIVSVFPANREQNRPVVNGLVLVLDDTTGEPVAVCDGTWITAMRTGAASGLATELLARADARSAAVIGCGAQARTQLLGIDCVRELDRIRVYGRRAGGVRRFVAEMQPRVHARLEAAASATEAVAGAAIVCAATTSSTPVFEGGYLAPGTHVNGVGSFTLEMREIDAATVGRARIFVDSLESALAEAGDLVLAEREGLTRREDWTELGLVAAGRRVGRRTEQEITLFKSVGHAVQDVAAATFAVRAARERGLGQEVEL